MFRLSNVIMALIVGGLVFLALGSIEAGSSLSHTCVLCRLGRVDTTWFGLTRSTFHENECSRWYAANVEPNHTHIWERGTCETILNGLAQPVGVGCRPGHYPIRLLDPSTQMHAYQHFHDRQKAKDLFRNLTDAKTFDDRLEEDFQSKGHLIVRSMEEWEVAGFPGTWDDWWSRWWEKHVAEHNEWLVWLRSDSHMSFWDWKDLQKTEPTPQTKKSK
jgi:hypothetical protein